jgi:hypothetical protein
MPGKSVPIQCEDDNMVRQFRKRPVTVEAIQITDGKSVFDIVEWMNSKTVGYQTTPPTIWIDTLEGRMTADQFDWIIKGVDGEFYPCKPHIFERTYQEV